MFIRNIQAILAGGVTSPELVWVTLCDFFDDHLTNRAGTFTLIVTLNPETMRMSFQF